MNTPKPSVPHSIFVKSTSKGLNGIGSLGSVRQPINNLGGGFSPDQIPLRAEGGRFAAARSGLDGWGFMRFSRVRVCAWVRVCACGKSSVSPLCAGFLGCQMWKSDGRTTVLPIFSTEIMEMSCH